MPSYELINCITGVFTAFGTVGATSIAAWTVWRQLSPHLKGTCDIRYALSGGRQPQEVLLIKVANLGEKKARIVTYGYSIGFFRKKHAIVKTNGPQFQNLCTTIEPMDESFAMLSIEDFKDKQMEFFIENLSEDKMCKNKLYAHLKLKSSRCYFRIANRNSVTCRLGPNLQKTIIEAFFNKNK
ncbi:hypothetical protein ACI3L3_09830 [Desulfobaculum sp. SPO524]|uniref:hypothetical protein n=1 Tax=Desulfobaculum sp. SPO524 TaxID=3378071 RepID=UPI003853A6A3